MQFVPFMRALEMHRPHDATEAAHLAVAREFVSANSEAFWQRQTAAGHVTGSAFVVNDAQTHALLLHHAKLNRWLQPGGHLDDSDVSPAAGAHREATEETGITTLLMAADAIFDIDVHVIPARNKDGQSEPAHFHHDVRFLMIAPENAVTISTESLGFRWVPLLLLADGNTESGLVRMAKKMLFR